MGSRRRIIGLITLAPWLTAPACARDYDHFFQPPPPDGASAGDASVAGSWTKAQPLPMPLVYAATVCRDHRIYLIGGEDASGSPRADVWSMPAAGGSWQPEAPLMMGRSQFAATVVNDQIYVLGGRAATNGAATASVEQYDGTSWSSAPPLLQTHARCAAATGSNGAIYLFDSSNEVFSGAGWAVLADETKPRDRLAAVVVGDDLYAIGGATGSEIAVRDVDAYNVTRGEWRQIAPLQTARATLAAAKDLQGRVYAIGGKQNAATTTVEVFVAGAWQPGPYLPGSPRAGAVATFCDGTLYVAGGTDGSSTFDDALILQP
jgi:N-acetylneuraminic acid mutarotase